MSLYSHQEFYNTLIEKGLRGEPASRGEACSILEDQNLDLMPLLNAAYQVRKKYFGKKVQVHILNNIQNGLCPEDCSYCSQSSITEAPVQEYPRKKDEEILEEARKAAEGGAYRYCMVLSGRGPSMKRVKELAGIIRTIKERHPIRICLSTGLMNEEMTQELKAAGLDRLNHNLNTSEEHYGKICTTHDWQDRLTTLRAAQKSGIELCSGMIVGMGEKDKDILDVAFQLSSMNVPSIPVNFLVPIPGNPMQSDGTLTPERCLRVLCMFRFTNPKAEIRVAAGREAHLRSLQPLSLYPANSLFAEGYLTTRGNNVEDTYRMILDSGFDIDASEAVDREALERARKAPVSVDGHQDLIKPSMKKTAEPALGVLGK